MCVCSEQYPLVEARLQDIGGRVAPINDAVKALKDLREYIRIDQVWCAGVRSPVAGASGALPAQPAAAVGRGCKRQAASRRCALVLGSWAFALA